VVDFGLAKGLKQVAPAASRSEEDGQVGPFISSDQVDEDLTRLGNLVGTKNYMAPERLKDSRISSRQSDGL